VVKFQFPQSCGRNLTAGFVGKRPANRSETHVVLQCPSGMAG
jgi:hypothetical protein